MDSPCSWLALIVGVWENRRAPGIFLFKKRSPPKSPSFCTEDRTPHGVQVSWRKQRWGGEIPQEFEDEKSTSKKTLEEKNGRILLASILRASRFFPSFLGADALQPTDSPEKQEVELQCFEVVAATGKMP